MKRSIYILHIRMMENLVDEIRMFYALKLITSDEIKSIRKDLHTLLDELENI